jgi:signal transduction histidine kinase
MENKLKSIFAPKNITKILLIASIALLLVLEILICVPFLYQHPEPWRIPLLILSCVLLDVFCFMEIKLVKSLRLRIIVYVLCYLMLLCINILAGSTYLSALYCVVLTQIYIDTEDIRPRLIIFWVSCLAYVVTFVIGWVLTNVTDGNWPTFTESMVKILSGCVAGILILTAHLFAMVILIDYYRTNRRLTKALRDADESRERLKDAYEQLSQTAVFEERNRIARDIHDNAGHSMTAVIMQTEAAKLLIDTNPEGAKASIIAANIQAKNALDQMRESVHLLAGKYNSRSLKSELEEVFAQTMDGTDLKIRSDLEDLVISESMRRFVISSVKECLSNGVRHGEAKAFYVEMKKEEGNLKLIVSDNGKGLSENYQEGFGLKGMREKAEELGGRMELISDEGCEVDFTLPLGGGN